MVAGHSHRREHGAPPRRVLICYAEFQLLVYKSTCRDGDAEASPARSRRGVRIDQDRPGTLRHEGLAALTLMQEALDLLDRCSGAAAVGAHLDLAICRLRELINEDDATGTSAATARITPISDSGPAS